MRMLQDDWVASTSYPAWTHKIARQVRYGVHGASEAKVVLAVAQLSRGLDGRRRVGVGRHEIRRKVGGPLHATVDGQRHGYGWLVGGL